MSKTVDQRIHDELDQFITYLEQTEDEDWQVDTVRNAGNTKNCAMGHLINWFYGPDFDGNISPAWDCFEWIWASDHMIYDVNDGRNPKYQQQTAKARTIAYLKNMWLGLETPTWKLWEQEADMQRSLRNA